MRSEQPGQRVAIVPHELRGPGRRAERPPDRLPRGAAHLRDRALWDPGAQEDAPVRRGHAGELGRRGHGIGREDHAEHREHHVGGRLLERNRRRVAGDEVGLQSLVGGPPARHLQQPRGGVHARHACAEGGGQQRGVAGAAAHVHHGLPSAIAARSTTTRAAGSS